MPPSPEPDRYSIDDMMDRLKNRPAEDPMEYGQLVTRADGSQAVRVRKRKRRSHQPHKDEQRKQRRSRMIQVSGALILLLLALAGAGFALAYANSQQYRESLVRQITAASGARAELSQFRVNPTYAVAGALEMDWPAGNALGTLKLRGIKAHLSPVSFLGNSMEGEDLLAQEGTLALRSPAADAPLRETVAGGAAAEPIRFERFAVTKFHAVFGDPATTPLRLWGSEATFTPKNRDGRPELLLNKGDLVARGWPKLRIDRAYIDFRGTDVNIVSLRLLHETHSDGYLELSGTLSPYTAGGASELGVLLKDYESSGILGPELGRLFSGRIDTRPAKDSNLLSIKPGPDAAASLAVTFQKSLGKSIELGGLPMLAVLSLALDDDWYGRPVFETAATGSLRREDGNVALEILHMESKGRMAVRGAVSMNPVRQLSGELEIGIAEGMLKTSGSRRLDAMFGPPSEGFRWLSLRIGGMAAAPTDNFKELYEKAASAAPATPAKGLPSFDDLTRPK